MQYPSVCYVVSLLITFHKKDMYVVYRSIISMWQFKSAQTFGALDLSPPEQAGQAGTTVALVGHIIRNPNLEPKKSESESEKSESEKLDYYFG